MSLETNMFRCILLFVRLHYKLIFLDSRINILLKPQTGKYENDKNYRHIIILIR
jgi:hypothetical protein